MKNCIILIIGIVVLLFFTMTINKSCKGGGPFSWWRKRKSSPAVYESCSKSAEVYSNINTSLIELTSIGIKESVIDSFLSMGKFLFTGIGYPSYGDAIPAVLRAISENIHLVEQIEKVDEITRKMREDRGFKQNSVLLIARIMGVMDGNDISITYEEARKKFTSLLNNPFYYPLRRRFERKVSIDIKLCLTLFFIQPRTAWQYYLKWIKSNKYRKLSTFREDVFQHGQEQFYDFDYLYDEEPEKPEEITYYEALSPEDFDKEPSTEQTQKLLKTLDSNNQVLLKELDTLPDEALPDEALPDEAPTGGDGGPDKSEKTILVEYNKQRFLNRLLLFIIWCPNNDNLVKYVLFCMSEATNSSVQEDFNGVCRLLVENSLRKLPIDVLSTLLTSKPLPEDFIKEIDNVLLPGIKNKP